SRGAAPCARGASFPAARPIRAGTPRPPPAPAGLDDGKASHPRGGPDGGGVHHLPDIFLPGGAPATEAARANDADPALPCPGTSAGGPGRGAEGRAPSQCPSGSPSPATPDDGEGPALSGGGQQRGRQAARVDARVSRREAHGPHW